MSADNTLALGDLSAYHQRFSVQVKVVGPIRTIGRIYMSMPVTLNGGPVTSMEYFWAKDRRQARRLSRKLGRKFKMTNRGITFGSVRKGVDDVR
jgi:hypothetical protein